MVYVLQMLWCWHVYVLAADTVIIQSCDLVPTRRCPYFYGVGMYIFLAADSVMSLMCCCAGEERIPDNEDILTTENVVYGIKGE